MKILFNNAIEHIKNGNFAELKKALYVGLLVVIIGLVGTIIFTLLTTDRSVFESLHHFEPTYLIFATCLALAPWFTNTVRVMIWTRFLGHRFSFFNILKITISAELGSALSPTAIGGGYIKAGMLMGRGLSVGKATSLLTLGSFENGLFFTIALPISIYLSKCRNLPVIQHIIERFKHNMVTVSLILLAVIVLTMTIRLLVRKRGSGHSDSIWLRLGNKIKDAAHDFLIVYKLIARNGKSRFAFTMTLTAIQWISRYSILTLMLYSFGIQADPILIFLLQWITFTLMTFIPTPGAAAGAEASFYLVYASLIPKGYVGLMTAGWRFLTFYYTILLGIVVLTLLYVVPVALKRKKNSNTVAYQTSQ